MMVDSAQTNPTSRPLVFGRVAGFWLVILALGLATLGVVITVQQAVFLNRLMLTQSHERAVDLASRAQTSFQAELKAHLCRAAVDLVGVGPSAWHPPPGWPDWIEQLFLWDGFRLTAVSEDGAVDSLDLGETARRVSLYFTRETVEFDPERHGVWFDEYEGRPLVLAYQAIRPLQSTPITLVARINQPLLKSRFLEPLLSSGEVFELVSPSEPSTPWLQPLFGVFRPWALRLSANYLNEQKSGIRWRTLAALSLPFLALMTMLMAVNLVGRAARRESHLAEMKANFVADVSHELKTPLAVIRLFGETLQSGRVATEERRQEYYETITRESTRLTNLINSILDFARIESGGREFEFRSTDVSQVARETFAALVPEMERHGFHHEIRLAEGLPPVDADPDAIARMVFNLLSNAVKYSTDDRHVVLELTTDVRRGRRGVLISVHDRGIGIRPEDRAQLFDGFFRSADRRVRDKGGTGLGLALVRRIAEAHGGFVDVESRLVQGSTFRVFLPATPSRETIGSKER